MGPYAKKVVKCALFGLWKAVLTRNVQESIKQETIIFFPFYSFTKTI